MIYLDNSASTYIKPKEVTKAVLDGLTNYSANPGRSGHKASMKTAEKVFEVRKLLCDYLNADKPEHIIFTQNCTESLNLGILGTYVKGGHVICSCNDHNSLSRPIFELEKQGLIEVSIVTPKKMHHLTAEDVEPLIKENTYLIAINHISNVNGDYADIDSIGELCAKKCILFMVDCAQSCGHIKIDMKKSHIDMLTIAPHKALYSPQGIGVFAFSLKANVKPIKFGGTGTESINIYQPTEYPETLESGTLATPNILGLGAGLQFVINNFNNICSKIDDLATFILFELSKIENVITYTHSSNVKFGVIGFNIKDVDSSEVSQILSDEYGICVRGGLHCAGLKHKALNTVNQGVVRISLSYFNNFTECEHLIKAIKKISRKYANINNLNYLK